MCGGGGGRGGDGRRDSVGGDMFKGSLKYHQGNNTS